ncbi:MAG TPA: hypothetical protein VH040_01640 [Usitatibacter sp.]|nr:hypothetical protein [Usitatibacter sp.]
MRLTREWVGLVLVVLGLARAALLIAHDPVVGYANQYDMIRTGACMGLFPATDAPARYERSPDAPLPLYRAEAPHADLCYRSTEVAIDAAVVAVAQTANAASDGIRIRWFGYAKLAILAITALALAWSLHRNPTAALLHGIVFAFVICDPVVTLWFNTMYTEFAALWGLYAAVASAAALAISSRGSFALAAILLTALVGLAFSREQFALLAPALAIIAFPWLWARSPHLAVASFGVALVSAVLSFALLPRPGLVASVNRVDTYLAVVLPAAKSPLRALSAVGLPARCEPLVGVSWYLRRGENLEELCPEVTRLPSYAFLRLARSDPDALARSVARVLPATQELAPRLGTLAGRRRVALNELPWWLRSPLHALWWRLPMLGYAWLVVSAMVALPLAFLAALAWGRPSREKGVELLLAMMLGTVTAYTLATTVFGDGLSEASRHFLPGALAALVALVSLVIAIPGAVLRWSAEPRPNGFAIGAAALAIAVVITAGAVSIRWAKEQPLAIGILDEPAGRTYSPNAPLTLRGWAIDPFGPETVTADVSGVRTELTLDAPTPDLRLMFPSYPGSERAGFRAELGVQDLAKAGAAGPPTLRLLVKSRTGAVTEVDRRRLEPAP